MTEMITKKPIIQICFSLKTGMSIQEISDRLVSLKEKLDAIYGRGAYECRSCHLAKHLCIEKGFSTEVPDMLAEVFGNQYVCELESEPTFQSAMANINDHRKQLAVIADKLVILSGETITNVALELSLFTQNRVIIC